MIHISKSAKTGLFHVAHLARNGEILSTSEGLTHRSDAVKNIRAHLKLYKTEWQVTVQDNTGTVIKVLAISPSSQIVLSHKKPKEPYVVG
jgi:uncharacterized protein YegP (UPF0339 family)